MLSCGVGFILNLTVAALMLLGYQKIMATVLELDAKIERILGDVADVALEVAELRAVIEGQAGLIDPAALDPILEKLGHVEAGLDGIVPDPVEEPVVE
jgi:hypothetical protein